MIITITAAPIEIDSKLSEHIRSKILKIAKKASLLDASNETHVEISKETGHHHKGDIYRVELNLRTKGKTHRAHAIKNDIRKAFDTACTALGEELQSHHKKQDTLFRKGAQKIKNFLRKT